MSHMGIRLRVWLVLLFVCAPFWAGCYMLVRWVTGA